VTAPYRRCASRNPVQRAQYSDLKIYLSNDVLVKVDRMSMMHGLEVRCPLLDHRLVEFAFRTPISTKMPRLRPKQLLRDIASTRLPRELLSQRKRGFTAPVGRWIAGPYADRFRADVFRPRSIVSSLLDKRAVETLFRDHCAGVADHSYALWAIWMLDRWDCSRNKPAAVTCDTDRAAASCALG
jgi:asparagine synthase (glutamine-hydrolysing)